MNTDFTKIDKSDFVCLQTGADKSHCFFGQLQWMNTETKELLPNLDEIENEEDKAKYVQVRHGAGIQLYGSQKKGGAVTCKYAGEWDRDEKTGDAHQTYADGSEYKGNLEAGVFQGRGMYWWAPSEEYGFERHYFLGNWKDGKMHGKGEFQHAQGHVLKGIFVNNLYCHVLKGVKYFLNPLDPKDQHIVHIANQRKAKQEASEKKTVANQKMRLFKVKTYKELQEVIRKCKDDERTPMMVSSHMAKLQSRNILETFNRENFEVSTVYVRDLALETEEVPYDQRQEYIGQKYRLCETLVERQILGERSGSLLLNFDGSSKLFEQKRFPTKKKSKRHSSDDEEEDSEEDNRSEQVFEFDEPEQSEDDLNEEQKNQIEKEKVAKCWRHMYDPDYSLLFNPYVFPEELLQGKKVGDFMLATTGLFDTSLKPQNIVLSKTHGGGDESPDDSHTIQFTITKKKQSVDEDKSMARTSARGSVNGADSLYYQGSGVRDSQGTKSSRQHAQELQGSMFNTDELRKHNLTMSQSSPRSNMSDQSKLKKQTEKLNEMKSAALAKLIGLDSFYFMIWSKVKFNHELSEEELLEQFKLRFEGSLPLKYIDMVVITEAI